MIVCHGGMNTVLEPLAAGLPMVVMPLAFEQSAIAARLRACRSRPGAELAGLGPACSRRPIAEVRETPSFRRARRSGSARDATKRAARRRAADLIEAALA